MSANQYYGSAPPPRYGAPGMNAPLPSPGNQEIPYGRQQQSGYAPYPPQHSSGLPPSPGYDPRVVAFGDASYDADVLRGAMKGFGTNEDQLIQILSKPDPTQMTLLRKTYSERFNRSLEDDIKKETSGHFREGLLALVRGPLYQDVENVYAAIKGLGTKELVLNDVLLGRSNADMRAIKQEYHRRFGHHLEADVKGDLSLKTERLFSMVMAANRAEEVAPIIPQAIDRDISELHQATEGRVSTDQITVCSILSSRSDNQIRVIAQQFEQRYRIKLETVIEKEFSGHMQDALLLMLGRATDPAMTAAVQLEYTMRGPGTRDSLLVNRVIRIHWNRDHMDQVKRAYMFRYKQDLIARIQKETSKYERKLLTACLT